MGKREREAEGGGRVSENGWEMGVKEKLETVREGRDREGVANRADRQSTKWRRELHRNMAEECGAAEWRGEIMGCEASSLPSSQAIPGLVQSVSRVQSLK